MREYIAELLRTFRLCYEPNIVSKKDDAETKDAYAQFVMESRHAWDTLNMAFKDQGLTEDTLKDMSDGAYDNLRKQLMGWASDLVWPSGASDGKWRSSALDAEDCRRQTEAFKLARFLPFIKIMR